MYCQNAACYLIFECHIKDRAENCSIHRWYLEGYPVFQYTEKELQEIEKHTHSKKDSTNVKDNYEIQI